MLEEELKNLKIPLSRIENCGITNQRETLVAWSKKSGRPLYNAIVWNDLRTNEICQEFIKKFKKNHFFKQKNGLLIDSYFSMFKLIWMLKNISEVKNSYE